MKTYVRAIVSLATLLLLGSAPFAHAQDGTPNPPNPPVNFCARITTTLDDTYHERLATQKSAITQRLGEVETKVAQRRAEADALRTQKRAEADQKRLAHYAKLMEVAGSNPTKIAAVDQFKTTIEAAVAVRKAAMDAAVATARAGHDQARAQRSVEIMTAFSTYEGLMKSAITAAQSQCGVGTAVATVRAAFVEAVKSAQSGLKTERTAITERYRVKMETVHSVRVAAAEQAHAVFKAAAEAARAALKAVLTN